MSKKINRHITGYEVCEVQGANLVELHVVPTCHEAKSYLQNYYGGGYLDPHVLVMKVETWRSDDEPPREVRTPRLRHASDRYVEGYLAGLAAAGAIGRSALRECGVVE